MLIITDVELVVSNLVNKVFSAAPGVWAILMKTVEPNISIAMIIFFMLCFKFAFIN